MLKGPSLKQMFHLKCSSSVRPISLRGCTYIGTIVIYLTHHVGNHQPLELCNIHIKAPATHHAFAHVSGFLFPDSYTAFKSNTHCARPPYML